ncbi:PASTA domain-containing protein [Nonomuraea sp. NPDC059023]|uniref:PASTA domain-containing protein n=1 Tax=unclassified Nonomuraea TaxID=2593643 RepID=UPI0036851496
MRMPLISIAMLTLACAACSSPGTAGLPAPAPATTITSPSSPAPAPPAPSPTPSPEPPEPPAARAKIPDVVGMNLQAAQDTMQAAGFYFLDDQDATGQDRLQIYDRNWVVTRQTPAAGRKADPATRITLWAKKHGE